MTALSHHRAGQSIASIILMMCLFATLGEFAAHPTIAYRSYVCVRLTRCGSACLEVVLLCVLGGQVSSNCTLVSLAYISDPSLSTVNSCCFCLLCIHAGSAAGVTVTTQVMKPPPLKPSTLSCTRSGTQVSCNGFLPSSPPGVLLSNSAPYGLTITGGIRLQGGSIDGNPKTVLLTTSGAGDALFISNDTMGLNMVQVSSFSLTLGHHGSIIYRIAWPAY